MLVAAVFKFIQDVLAFASPQLLKCVTPCYGVLLAMSIVLSLSECVTG